MVNLVYYFEKYSQRDDFALLKYLFKWWSQPVWKLKVAVFSFFHKLQKQLLHGGGGIQSIRKIDAQWTVGKLTGVHLSNNFFMPAVSNFKAFR